MTDDVEIPEPDRIPGAPHPRETAILAGQDAAEQAFLSAWTEGALHHAWLLTGPEGIGKATLAWRIARFLIAAPDDGQGGRPGGGPSLFGEAPALPRTLDIDPDHPVSRRLRALSEPRLFLLRRGPNQRGTALSDVIRVDQIRALAEFLHLSAADGGQRVVLVDAADEMNSQAANALLKFLEEPPRRVTFLLVSHRPSALLPTVRSRCRTLKLSMLDDETLSRAVRATGLGRDGIGPGLTALAEGSPGRAVRLLLDDGPRHYDALVTLFASLPRLDRRRAVDWAERTGRRGADTEAGMALDMGLAFLARLARSGTSPVALPEIVPGEAPLLARLSPDPAAARAWADLHATVSGRIRHGRAVNLDPAALLLDMVLRISETAGRVAAG
ncbi:MAG: DNA polymerase III subunit delta' [Pseudomonadota bacterium]